ncbi:MAG: glutamine-hydrolyzing carbamoyl-phosphate synthase small subunit [Chloroflexi bacterium]|nr:glutamine-hydrolyzing carbamoyl-phosphate synthase small subunit [Chloroflexota bacterium]
MSDKALLVLEGGTAFAGRPFGAAGRAHGEVVFSTAMTGYQEMLTDPSYAGQVLVLTYPLAGNYGINRRDVESRRIQVSALVVREACDVPSHWAADMTLHEYLASEGIPGLHGVDTRAITRKLRSFGVMMGTITADESPEEALARLRSLPSYGSIDFVRAVSTDKPYEWPDKSGAGKLALSGAEGPEKKAEEARYHVAVVDGGVKYNILRLLRERGCRVTALPCTVSAEDVLALEPDGVVFSPGPGDPALLDYMVGTVEGLVGKVPVLGICLGHQLLGRAFGAKTFKLKFGHRGANHPVKDLLSGRVHITAQNHGYAVDPEGLCGGVEVSHVHLNDGTCEGLYHPSLPLLSIQYHSEASPGPLDNVYVFDRFLELVEATKGSA